MTCFQNKCKKSIKNNEKDIVVLKLNGSNLCNVVTPGNVVTS